MESGDFAARIWWLFVVGAAGVCRWVFLFQNQNDELKDAKLTVQSHLDGQETFWSVYVKVIFVKFNVSYDLLGKITVFINGVW